MPRLTFARLVAPGFAAVLVVAAAAGSARAGIVYNNGAPNPSDGNEMTEWVQAEDFKLTSTKTIKAVRFWDVENQGSYQGSISWAIYGDAGGTPGTAIASGNTSAVTRSATGAPPTFGDEFVNDFSIGSVTLVAGTYWLALHNGPLSVTTREEFYWASTDFAPAGTNSGQEDEAPFEGSFVDNGTEHAFILFDAVPTTGNGGGGTGVPVPAAVWMGLVTAGTCVMPRLRRK